jgi:hypothetical protein
MRKDKLKSFFAFPLSLKPQAGEYVRRIPQDLSRWTAGWTFSGSLLGV